MAFALSDMQLTSTAFESGARIPKKHTGEDVDVSPALAWSGAPEGTQSFAMICHDPDAPLVAGGDYGYTHWVLYNIPSDVMSLDEGDERYSQGIRGNGQSAYMGPMPPPGHGTHRYFFWVLAMSSAPDLPPGLTLPQLLEAVEPSLLGMNRLVGEYSRG